MMAQMMGHKFRAIVFLLMIAGQASASEIKVVETPVPVTSFAEAGITIADNESVIWLVNPEPVKIVEVGTVVYFNGPAGSYSVTALVFSVSKEGKLTSKKYKASVVIGQKPVPIPPVPDPSVNSFQPAFDQDTDADKLASATKLAAVYRAGAALNDPNIKTYGDMFDVLTVTSRGMLSATAIPKTRQAVGSRLNPMFSNPAAPIDLAKTKALLTSVATDLAALK